MFVRKHIKLQKKELHITIPNLGWNYKVILYKVIYEAHLLD